MIGKSVQDLVNASQGNFAGIRGSSAKMLGPVGATGAMGSSGQVPPDTSAYATALANRRMYAPAPATLRGGALLSQAAGVATGGLEGDINASANAVTPGANVPATRLYADILASTTRSPVGLSSKGKYGGFYNVGDLEAAIRGSATNIRSLAPQLRSEADKYYTALDTAYSEAGKEPSRYFATPGMAQLPSVRPEYQYGPDSYVGKIVNPSRTYAKALSDWYAKAAAPAEEYYTTAQQIETTPLSQLAERIAVSQYGMNPNLAAGKFTDLDTTYAKQQRDQQYIAQYGVPYDMWMAEQTKAQKDYAAMTTAQQTQVKNYIEQGTGFSGDRLKTQTNMTPMQMYEAMTNTYDYGGESLSGQDLIDMTYNLIDSGDSKGAMQLADDLNAAGANAIYRLINALINFSLGKPAAVRSSTETSLGM